MTNNLGTLRLIAAGLVVFGHSFPMLDQVAPSWFGVPVHVMAVHAFFTVSGYLVAGSWRADPSIPRYACRRALRIMPALVMVVLATACVLGPTVTSLPLGAYVASPVTHAYFWNLVLAPAYALPGVFQDGRALTAVNGSLWTLPIEVAMYVALPLYAGHGAVRERVVLPAVVVAAVCAGFAFNVVWPNQVQPVLWWNSVPFGLRHAGDFALGALVCVWRLERRLSAQVALLLLAGLGVLPEGWLRGAALAVALPYVVLSFGLATPSLLPWAGRTDLSYGVYLWGFPVQQALLSILGRGIGPWTLAAAALGASALLGLLSWHLVERPFLRRKPGRMHAASVGELAHPS